jgi:hypothetical protein
MNDVIRHALQLAHGNLLRIEAGKGLLVTVVRGEIWLTEEGERDDYILTQGQSHRLERPGLCLVYAWETSELSLAAPRSREHLDTPAVVRVVPALRCA